MAHSYYVEWTDTFAGEANYSWVRRTDISVPELTVTTKRKMNQAANQFGLGYGVFQRKGDWFVTTRGGEFPFKDGMRIDRGSGRAYEPLA